VIALRRSYYKDFSRYCFYYYYKSIVLVYCFPLLLVLFRVGHKLINMSKDIVTVIGGNILDGI
jgi:hypothetical protein